MKGWMLTVRHRSQVSREHFDSLEDAVEALHRTADSISSESPLKKVSSLRDFEPGEQVHARLEISTGGLLRGRDAGVDVMGDGTLVPFSGGMRRTELELRGGQSPFEAVGQALADRA